MFIIATLYLHCVAPLSPPEDFHLIALNTTSIEVQWDLPPYNSRGGIIRGYKIFVQPANGGEETMIDVPDNRTEEYIVTGLQRDSPYRISVLAYTSAGDGPRTLILTIDTLGKQHHCSTVYQVRVYKRVERARLSSLHYVYPQLLFLKYKVHRYKLSTTLWSVAMATFACTK